MIRMVFVSLYNLGIAVTGAYFSTGQKDFFRQGIN